MELDPTEQRIIGSLLEKQVTVPATYPLSLNALKSACNQTSSRDPLTHLDDHELETTTRALRDRGLIRIVWADKGRRTLKYHQTLDEAVELTPGERALVTVLLLRGPQSPGELRTRTERLHAFGDREAVEACLKQLADRELVRELERRPGQQDHRWMHLLGPAPEAEPETAAAPDRERVLADGPEARDERIRQFYAHHSADEPAPLPPFECWLLDRVAEEAGPVGPVVDAGCGPGEVVAYLADQGADARGIDLTPEMIAQAQEQFPGLPFEVGDFRRLMRPEDAGGWAAALAWYSLVHLAPSELPGAVAALARPLAPGGLLLLAFHTEHTEHTEPGVDVIRHEPAEVVAAVTAAGLTEIEWYRRGPQEDETSERLYVLARREG